MGSFTQKLLLADYPWQYLSTKSLKMSKIAKKQFKTAQNKAKKIMKKQSKPRALRKLQKSKPKRYMNPYLCFLQEQRKLFKGGKLLSDWRLAHKGLGGKWKTMDKATKAKYVASSKNMKGSYDNQMKAYRLRKKELLRSIRVAKMAKKARRVLKKRAKRVLKKKTKKSSKKLKSAKKAKKVSPKKGKKKVKSAKKAKVAQKKGKKGVARKINARALPQ